MWPSALRFCSGSPTLRVPRSAFRVPPNSPTLRTSHSALRVRPNSPTLRVPRSAFRVPLVRFVPLVVFLLPLSLHAKSDAPSYAAPVFDRFQGIIERMPFGKAPPPAPVAPVGIPAPQANQENQLGKQLAMVAVNHTPAGDTTVGFIDNSQKPPHNYYLGVGEDADGFTIVSANYEEETATISKDGISVTLQLGKGVVGLPSAMAAAPAPAAVAAPRLISATPVMTAAAVADPTERAILFPESKTADGLEVGKAIDPKRTLTDAKYRPMPDALVDINRLLRTGVKDDSYVARLQKRRDEMVRMQEAAQKKAELTAQEQAKQLSKEELAKKLRDINMSLLRQGMKPIDAIELTPEEDAQLVRDGVLPAQ